MSCQLVFEEMGKIATILGINFEIALALLVTGFVAGVIGTFLFIEYFLG